MVMPVVVVAVAVTIVVEDQIIQGGGKVKGSTSWRCIQDSVRGRRRVFPAAGTRAEAGSGLGSEALDQHNDQGSNQTGRGRYTIRRQQISCKGVTGSSANRFVFRPRR